MYESFTFSCLTCDLRGQFRAISQFLDDLKVVHGRAVKSPVKGRQHNDIMIKLVIDNNYKHDSMFLNDVVVRARLVEQVHANIAILAFHKIARLHVYTFSTTQRPTMNSRQLGSKITTVSSSLGPGIVLTSK